MGTFFGRTNWYSVVKKPLETPYTFEQTEWIYTAKLTLP